MFKLPDMNDLNKLVSVYGQTNPCTAVVLIVW